MDEVSDMKNVERRTEHEKLHFGIFLTIIILCKKGNKEANVGCTTNERPQKAEDLGLMNVGCPQPNVMRFHIAS